MTLPAPARRVQSLRDPTEDTDRETIDTKQPQNRLVRVLVRLFCSAHKGPLMRALLLHVVICVLAGGIMACLIAGPIFALAGVPWIVIGKGVLATWPFFTVMGLLGQVPPGFEDIQ